MIYWILIALSLLIMALVFYRRFQVVLKDNQLQNALQEEVAMESRLESEGVVLDEPEHLTVQKSDVRPLWNQAVGHIKRKEWEEATACLVMLLQGDPNHVEAHHELGMIHMNLRQFPDAELYFSRLVNLRPDATTFSNLGAALYEQQRLVEAAEAYENAIAMDEHRANRFASLAQVYFELGNDERALELFELAVKKNSRNVPLLLHLVDYYERLGRLEEAQLKLQRAIALAPKNEDLAVKMAALVSAKQV